MEDKGVIMGTLAIRLMYNSSNLENHEYLKYLYQGCV